MTITREQARVVACPRCHAVAGEKCRGERGGRRPSNHPERVQLAKASRDPRARIGELTESDE